MGIDNDDMGWDDFDIGESGGFGAEGVSQADPPVLGNGGPPPMNLGRNFSENRGGVQPPGQGMPQGVPQDMGQRQQSAQQNTGQAMHQQQGMPAQGRQQMAGGTAHGVPNQQRPPEKRGVPPQGAQQVPAGRQMGAPQNMQARQGMPNGQGMRPQAPPAQTTTMGRVDAPRVQARQQVRPQQRAELQYSEPEPQYLEQQEAQLQEGRRRGRGRGAGDAVPMLEDGQRRRKKKKPLLLVLLVLLLAGGGFAGYTFYMKNRPVPQEVDYSVSGKAAYDRLLAAMNTYSAEAVDAAVGPNAGDSYIAQEWSYANNNEIRQNFIKSVCANVKFEYPLAQKLDTKGRPLIGADGQPEMVVSPMNSGEKVTVTYVDYEKIAAGMREDANSVVKIYKASKLSPEDYDYRENMTDLMLDYIMMKGSFPTLTTEISLGATMAATPIVSSDMELDKLLFSSDAFHDMCDTFAQVATGFTGYETEKYTEKEEQPNPEYAQWKLRFDAYYAADNGVFNKNTSKWEPWYKRDENNNYILDAEGNQVVNYYSVKDDEGNDWIQPAEKVLVDVEKERQVPVEWVPESVIPYCFMGAYYCQNEYKGTYSPEVRVGDGSLEFPAGVGTPIITRVKGTDGEYHDVKVTMVGYWTGQDAIDYAVSFSEKNRGLDVTSVVQLICYELKVENLENREFTFGSEMYLADRSSNKSVRSGTMYGFKSEATLEPKGYVVINDWATSTELENKYAVWGSSFSRNFPTVYFKILAGEGDTPAYSAYKAFTGKSLVVDDPYSGVEGGTGTEQAPGQVQTP